MKIDICKVTSNPDFARMAAEYLAYSLQDVKTYQNLTPKEREIISEEMFNSIQHLDTRQMFTELKQKHPDTILLFRMGDFYEARDKDAEVCSSILGITLTVRTNDKLAGFPYHALDTYLPKLIRAGHRVAICDQLEDPKMTKKLVKRGITELVSPRLT